MPITVLSRWKGDLQNAKLAKEIAPILKRHGAVSVRLGFLARWHACRGDLRGDRFPDWASYGRAMQAVWEDPEYKQILAELSKAFELQERSILVTEDL